MTTAQENYTAWLAAEIQATIDDPRPSIPHEEVMSRMNTKIADALAMPGIAEIEFDPPRVTIEPQPVDFSEDRFLAQSCTEFYAIF